MVGQTLLTTSISCNLSLALSAPCLQLDILEPGNLVVMAFGLVLGLFWLLFLFFCKSLHALAD
jgi:hypothetical protein